MKTLNNNPLPPPPKKKRTKIAELTNKSNTERQSMDKKMQDTTCIQNIDTPHHSIRQRERPYTSIHLPCVQTEIHLQKQKVSDQWSHPIIHMSDHQSQ